MRHFDDTDPRNIDRLNALDEIESLRSLGYSDAKIGRELHGTDLDVLHELVEVDAPTWTEDDGEGSTTEGW